MKSLNEFINESLNESVLSKITGYYQRNIKNRKSIAELLQAVKKVVNNKYKNYGVEIKKSADVIKDKNCVTLNMDETTFRIISDKVPGLLDYVDDLGYKDSFKNYYKQDPNADVLCLYDKSSPKHLYSIMDLYIFGLSKSQGRWIHNNRFPNDSELETYIEHCIREISAYKNPEDWKNGKEFVGSTDSVLNY